MSPALSARTRSSSTRRGRASSSRSRTHPRLGRLAPQPETLGRAAQPVERLQRLLARARRVGELLLGLPAIGEQQLEPPFDAGPPGGRAAAAPIDVAQPLLEPGQVELRDPCPQAGDLDAELLRPLGGGRLERERPQPLLDLGLDVAGALDLDRDARELELGTVAAGLEAAEPRGLLDQRPALGGPRGEDRLDLALADDRVHPLAEPEVGEQLDEVEPPHSRPVDEVLTLAAAVQPPRDGELCVVDGQRAVGVVEEELDLAEVRRSA